MTITKPTRNFWSLIVLPAPLSPDSFCQQESLKQSATANVNCVLYIGTSVLVHEQLPCNGFLSHPHYGDHFRCQYIFIYLSWEVTQMNSCSKYHTSVHVCEIPIKDVHESSCNGTQAEMSVPSQALSNMTAVLLSVPIVHSLWPFLELWELNVNSPYSSTGGNQEVESQTSVSN